MSTSRLQRSSRRLLLVGTGLVLIACGVLWLASRHIRPARPSEPQKSTSGASVPSAARLERSITAAAAASEHPARLGTHRALSYGSGEGQPGLRHLPGQPPVGPESFAVRKDGAILVADVVNQRVLVYSTNGTSLQSLRVPGLALGDVLTDAQGRLYVYDQARRSLHQYDLEGVLQSEINLNPADIDTRGYFHIAGNRVYFADAAARDVWVATLQEGRLTAPDGSAERTTEGVHGESGRVYAVAIDKERALRIQVQDPAAGAVAGSIEVPVPGIVSARYAGEDQARQFYVQTERIAGTNIILEVFAFSASGQPLATTRLPQNDYAIWTAKLVAIANDGTIVQFLPQRDQAQLNLFPP